jgi:hypothetical protein
MNSGPFQNHFLGPLIIPPTQGRRLAQLLIVGPFRINDFTQQLRLNSLDVFLDLGRVLEP